LFKSIDGCSIPENGLPNMTEKGVCLVVLWTIVRYENNNSGKKISQSLPIVAPWYHVGIDLVKMPKSKSGNSYILIHCYCLSQLMVVLFQKMVFRT
jgi:hypothetical protein